jgi:hypothetical protein
MSAALNAAVFTQLVTHRPHALAVLRVGVANRNGGAEWSSPRVGRLARSAGSPGVQGNAFPPCTPGGSALSP